MLVLAVVVVLLVVRAVAVKQGVGMEAFILLVQQVQQTLVQVAVAVMANHQLP
jgi:hypothetical protein